MRVVILGKWYESLLVGGVAVHVNNLVTTLSEFKEIELYMVSFADKTKSLDLNGAKIILLKSKKIYYLFPILALAKLRITCIKIKPDIIHLQGTNLSPYLLFLTFFPPRAPKKVITVHGVMQLESNLLPGRFHFFMRILKNEFEKIVLSKIKNIIVLTPLMKNCFLGVTNSKFYIVPNGVNFSNESRAHSNILLSHPSIFFIGRLEKVKGVDLLLRAMSIVLIKHPSAHLYIAGSGEQEVELKLLAEKLRIQKNTTFLGFIFGEKKEAYLSSVDLCIIPSPLYDSFPIVLLEAMAHGKAIIASNVGGIPYVISDGLDGLLFKKNDLNDLVEKIDLLLSNDPLMKTLGIAAREKARKYDWHNIAKLTINVYSDIIHRL